MREEHPVHKGASPQSVTDTHAFGHTRPPPSRKSRFGHRRIAARLEVPAATVRGWLRRAGRRLELMRLWFLGVAVRTGIDVAIPDGFGCPWRDVVAAVASAAAAIRARFGPTGLLGAVMVAVGGAGLLAPGWPPVSQAVLANTSCP